ncbi:MAG TPA: ester cyclase [Luteitalea sp.]|nr:ester cyclase [Luteitalea sp.]
MSHETHLGCRWFEEVWNRRNPDAIAALTPPEMRAHGADGQERGRDGMRQFYEMFVATVPDIHVEVVNCAHGGDHAAVQWVARGTHSGNVDGWPASGNPIEVTGLTLMRLEGDRIAEAWDSFDMAGLMRTMNAPPA